jgi:hypothetical protein
MPQIVAQPAEQRLELPIEPLLLESVQARDLGDLLVFDESQADQQPIAR